MPEIRIPIDQLRIGMFIHIEMKWYEHPFFFSSFKIKSAQQIQVLRQLGLSDILYSPEKSDLQTVKPPVSTTQGQCSTQPEAVPADMEKDRLWEVKKERIRRYRERSMRIQRCEKDYQHSFAEIARVIQNLYSGSREAAKETDALIQGMVDSLLSERDIVVHLVNVKGQDEGFFYHTLNVAILAMLLGKEHGINADAMRKLGLGAIFHDIGKSRIPKKLLYKRGPLTTPERRLIELHPHYGEQIASRIPDFPEESIEVIKQHHEALDGRGYPGRLMGDEISLLSKITSIANAYDNCCNRLDPEDSLTPHEALSLMFGRQRSCFDEELLTIFIRCLGVYPPGTVLQLSNDLIGMVVSISTNNQLRPCVLVYDPQVPANEAITVDLEDEPDVTIARSIRPSQLAPEIHAYLNPRARVSYYIENLPARV